MKRMWQWPFGTEKTRVAAKKRGEGMTKGLLLGAATLVAAGFFAAGAQAGPIERACIKSDRQAASRSLCGCIQQVADITLDRRDQKLAATFFRDPHRAQEVRQSDRQSHEVFWKKYKAFGRSAENYCS